MSRDVALGVLFMLGVFLAGFARGEGQAIGVALLFYVIGVEDGRSEKIVVDSPNEASVD